MQVQWEVAISASHGFVSLNQSEGALAPRPNPNPNPNPDPNRYLHLEMDTWKVQGAMVTELDYGVGNVTDALNPNSKP